MTLAGRFEFFDPKQPFSVTFGDLPHWEQDGASYFITFRTQDSIPSSLSRLLTRQRDDWLKRHGIDPERQDWRATLRQRPYEFQLQFHREYAAKLEAALDCGHGSCVLANPAVAQIVADALLFFDGRHGTETIGSSATSESGIRYHVSDFVVMPNHVHVLVCFLRGIRLLDQCRTWKHFTARKINAAIGVQGEFWQRESFDHLVRDAEHFLRFRKYIADNPTKANLGAGQYLLYQGPE